MDNNTFSNETILAWLNFFSNGTLIDLEHVKILDITRKNKKDGCPNIKKRTGDTQN